MNLVLTTPELFLWAGFILLLLVCVASSWFSVIKARQSFGVMGQKGPAGFVIQGLEMLAAAVVATAMLIAVGRVMVAFGDQMPDWLRVTLFYLLMGLVGAGFTFMAIGFHKHAAGVLRIRSHWLYTKGFGAGDPLTDAQKPDEQQDPE